MPRDQAYRFTRNDKRIVRRALMGVSEHEREVVLMRYWEELSIDEIALIIQSTKEKVEETLAQAYEKLRGLCLRHPEFSLAMRLKTLTA